MTLKRNIESVSRYTPGTDVRYPSFIFETNPCYDFKEFRDKFCSIITQKLKHKVFQTKN